ncbi:MAG: response regulator [Candidatus Cloacimonetes bacterium]|jgi:DNA-binding NtrC family response regulator|nr:response regulator [Candidatus Cloacimonadota bacterium]MDD4155956.1 response regulator [Candidatus Cloacimonadota bacterium]
MISTNKCIKIIITDDEPDILQLLNSELTDFDENFEITLANSGYEALNCLQSEGYDMLITDIAMPDMDGFELYKRAKDIRPDISIIMMTGFGYDPNHTVVNAKKAGLKDVIFKPFDISKLVSMIYQRVH